MPDLLEFSGGYLCKYRKGWLKTTLPISFQFHHSQMDGGHGAMFLELLQREITQLGC